MPSCRLWKSGRGKWMHNRFPQNPPPTWCPGKPRVLAPGNLSDMHLCLTEGCLLPPNRRCTAYDIRVLLGVPHQGRPRVGSGYRWGAPDRVLSQTTQNRKVVGLKLRLHEADVR